MTTEPTATATPTRPGPLARAVSHKRGMWIILVIWIGVVAALGPLAGKLTGAEDNQITAFLPGNAESTQVSTIVNHFENSDELPTVVIYTKTGGLTPADLAAISGQARTLGDVDRVQGAVVGPILSAQRPNPAAAYLMVPVNAGSDGWAAMPDVVNKFRAISGTVGDGITAHVTGPGGTAADREQAFSAIDTTLLFAALGVVVLLMLLTYRSPSLWFVPVLGSGIALVVAQGLVYLLVKHTSLVVTAQGAGIMMVLVFGAAADYALLVVARYREELRRDTDRHAAMAAALHRAGPAIWSSAATVIFGLLCLSFADLNSTAGLGPVAAIGVLVAVLAMTTLFPVLLVACGRWVFWPFRPDYGSTDPSSNGRWAALGAAVARRPRTTWIAGALVLGAVALTSIGLQANGTTDAGWFVGTQDSVTGEQVFDSYFPASTGQPVQVVAAAAKAGEVRSAFAGIDGIEGVSQPEIRDGYVYLQASTTDRPDTRAAEDTVVRVRAGVHAIPGADAKVGGQTASLYDTALANQHDRDLIIPLVLLVVFLIIAFLLRSLVAPAVLMITVVLSLFAALGVSKFFFNSVFHFAGADGSYPLFVFVFLVALGVDYNIFLMTRVREESQRLGTRRGALAGLASTGGVITSAGLVLAGTFAALGVLPAVEFVQVGFSVAVGVLIDTFIVRTLLVTALTIDLGRWMWWPSALGRRREDRRPVRPSADRPVVVDRA